MIEKVSRNFNKFGLKVRKASPEILIVAGAVGVVASAVMACKATLKLDEVLEEPKEKIEKIHECLNNEEFMSSGKYTEEDGKKDLLTVYVQGGMQVAKLYAPSVILGTLSLGAILTSHHILRSRNIALAAAYATIERGFKDYRGRVVERFGKRVDYELKNNIKAMEIEKVETDEEGNEKVIKESQDVVQAPSEKYSEYARFFAVGNPNWQKDASLNLSFLRQQEKYMNDLLRSRGHVFLNEVYDCLGIPRTKAGQIVGWVYSKDNPVGDNYIDFGIYDVYKPAIADFVNGYERSILLDFNPDGNIWELI